MPSYFIFNFSLYFFYINFLTKVFVLLLNKYLIEILISKKESILYFYTFRNFIWSNFNVNFQELNWRIDSFFLIIVCYFFFKFQIKTEMKILKKFQLSKEFEVLFQRKFQRFKWLQFLTEMWLYKKLSLFFPNFISAIIVNSRTLLLVIFSRIELRFSETICFHFGLKKAHFES
jgi:hypothetical protein